MATATTQEIKYGINIMVWVTFLTISQRVR